MKRLLWISVATFAVGCGQKPSFETRDESRSPVKLLSDDATPIDDSADATPPPSDAANDTITVTNTPDNPVDDTAPSSAPSSSTQPSDNTMPNDNTNTPTSGSTGGSTGANSDDTATPPAPTSEPTTDTPTASEVAECAKSMGVKSSAVRYSGKEKQSVASSEAFLIKVSGQADITVNFKGKDGMGCVFATGNASVSVNVSEGSSMKGFSVWERGNKPTTHLTVNKDASVQSIDADLRGNKPKLIITKKDNGSAPCPAASGKKNGGSIVCE